MSVKKNNKYCIDIIKETSNSNQIYTIHKENYPFQHFWIEFFFPKIFSRIITTGSCKTIENINLIVRQMSAGESYISY